MLHLNNLIDFVANNESHDFEYFYFVLSGYNYY